MTAVEESIQMCPVCEENGKSNHLQLYQINYTKAVYLCKEPNCIYPKGHSWMIISRNILDSSDEDSDNSNNEAEDELCLFESSKQSSKYPSDPPNSLNLCKSDSVVFEPSLKGKGSDFLSDMPETSTENYKLNCAETVVTKNNLNCNLNNSPGTREESQENCLPRNVPVGTNTAEVSNGAKSESFSVNSANLSSNSTAVESKICENTDKSVAEDSHCKKSSATIGSLKSQVKSAINKLPENSSTKVNLLSFDSSDSSDNDRMFEARICKNVDKTVPGKTNDEGVSISVIPKLERQLLVSSATNNLSSNVDISADSAGSTKRGLSSFDSTSNARVIKPGNSRIVDENIPVNKVSVGAKLTDSTDNDLVSFNSIDSSYYKSICQSNKFESISKENLIKFKKQSLENSNLSNSTSTNDKLTGSIKRSMFSFDSSDNQSISQSKKALVNNNKNNMSDNTRTGDKLTGNTKRDLLCLDSEVSSDSDSINELEKFENVDENIYKESDDKRKSIFVGSTESEKYSVENSAVNNIIKSKNASVFSFDSTDSSSSDNESIIESKTCEEKNGKKLSMPVDKTELKKHSVVNGGTNKLRDNTTTDVKLTRSTKHGVFSFESSDSSDNESIIHSKNKVESIPKENDDKICVDSVKSKKQSVLESATNKLCDRANTDTKSIGSIKRSLFSFDSLDSSYDENVSKLKNCQNINKNIPTELSACSNNNTILVRKKDEKYHENLIQRTCTKTDASESLCESNCQTAPISKNITLSPEETDALALNINKSFVITNNNVSKLNLLSTGKKSYRMNTVKNPINNLKLMERIVAETSKKAEGQKSILPHKKVIATNKYCSNADKIDIAATNQISTLNSPEDNVEIHNKVSNSNSEIVDKRTIVNNTVCFDTDKTDTTTVKKIISKTSDAGNNIKLNNTVQSSNSEIADNKISKLTENTEKTLVLNNEVLDLRIRNTSELPKMLSATEDSKTVIQPLQVTIGFSADSPDSLKFQIKNFDYETSSDQKSIALIQKEHKSTEVSSKKQNSNLKTKRGKLLQGLNKPQTKSAENDKVQHKKNKCKNSDYAKASNEQKPFLRTVSDKSAKDADNKRTFSAKKERDNLLDILNTSSLEKGFKTIDRHFKPKLPAHIAKQILSRADEINGEGSDSREKEKEIKAEKGTDEETRKTKNKALNMKQAASKFESFKFEFKAQPVAENRTQNSQTKSVVQKNGNNFGKNPRKKKCRTGQVPKLETLPSLEEASEAMSPRKLMSLPQVCLKVSSQESVSSDGSGSKTVSSQEVSEFQGAAFQPCGENLVSEIKDESLRDLSFGLSGDGVKLEDMSLNDFLENIDVGVPGDCINNTEFDEWLGSLL